MVLASVQVKTVHALDHSATVTGWITDLHYVNTALTMQASWGLEVYAAFVSSTMNSLLLY
jgi:hypothetical protein